MTAAQEKHTAWLTAEIQAAIDDPRPIILHEEVRARMNGLEGNVSENRK